MFGVPIGGCNALGFRVVCCDVLCCFGDLGLTLRFCLLYFGWLVWFFVFVDWLIWWFYGLFVVLWLDCFKRVLVGVFVLWLVVL